jgi:hypothetical protein
VAAGEKSGELVPLADLGIGYPVLVYSSPIRKVRYEANPMASAKDAPPADLKRYEFILQFTWQPTTPGSKLPPPPTPADAGAVAQ